MGMFRHEKKLVSFRILRHFDKGQEIICRLGSELANGSSARQNVP